MVSDVRFRFDFTHFKAVDKKTLEKIERLVNEKLLEAHPVRWYTTSLEFAKESGVVALFGEKYGEFVRVLEVGNFSKELCGGTHVSNTSQIGLLKIVGEGSIGANLRRIEVLTSSRALGLIYKQQDELNKAASLLKIEPSKVASRVKHIVEELKVKEKQLGSLKGQQINTDADEVLARAKNIKGSKIAISEVNAHDMNSLRSFADILKSKVEKGILVLGAKSDSKVMLVAAATKNLVNKGFSAGDLLKKVAPTVGGGGGGRADMAQAGGKHPDKLPEALKLADKYVKEYFSREAS